MRRNPSPEHRQSPTAVRTLAVWCPDWPVVAAGIDGSQVPAAVVFANRVVACSPAARRDGVRRGLRRREAQGRSPDLVLVELDEGRDARAFEPVVAAVERLTPRVELTRPGLCGLATRGPSRYLGGDHALAARVAAEVAAVLPAGATCRVGVADGPFAAALAARAPSPGVGVVVPPGGTAAFLAPFPVSALETPDLADLLRRLGIRTLGALATLPAVDVLARFGPDGERAHRLAGGLDPRLLAGREPPPDLAVAIELDPPADQVDRVAFAARHLAYDLHAELARRGLACSCLVVHAETEHGETLTRRWRHAGVTAMTPAAVAERVRWQLDGWLHDGGVSAGITLLRLAPDQVHPDDGRQVGFWGGAEAGERVTRALARVQGMLGPEAVATAVPAGGRAHGEQVELVPWGDAVDGVDRIAPRYAPPKRTEAPPWPGRVPAPAPAVVHPSPRPVAVLDAGGRSVGVTGRGFPTAAPALVDGDAVVAWSGPWPADERWWDPAAHRRRARFQLQTAAGAAYLAAVEGGRWFIEAEYD